MYIEELLPPSPDISLLEEYLSQLEKVIKIVNTALSQLPSGNLSVNYSNSSPQYYLRTSIKDKKGKYIRKNQKQLIQALAQKKYFQELLPVIKKEYSMLERFIITYKKLSAINIYKKQNISCQSIINPVTFDKSRLLQQWKNIEYTPLAFSDDFPKYFTSSNLRVRSKSEIIIAEVLQKYEIPFFYEKPLSLKNENNSVCIHPDFTCLNIKTHQTILWEHFGMMDNPDYAKATVEKINLYQANGYTMGRNLICTFETSAVPLSSISIKNLILKIF